MFLVLEGNRGPTACQYRQGMLVELLATELYLESSAWLHVEPEHQYCLHSLEGRLLRSAGLLYNDKVTKYELCCTKFDMRAKWSGSLDTA